MNPRAAAAVWGAAVAAVLVVVPLSLRGRLPDPLATRWRFDEVPTGSTSLTGDLFSSLGLWAVLWLPLIVIAARGQALSHRKARAFWWGGLFGGGVFVLGVEAVVLLVNLDVPDWSQVRMPVWIVPLVVLGSAAVGVVAGYLGRGAPDPVSDVRPAPALRLRQGQRAVWVSRVVNGWIVLLTVGVAVAIAVLCGLWLAGAVTAGTLLSALPGVVIMLVAGLMTATLSVRVGDDTLVIGFGPLGRPSRRIPLSRIDGAWTEVRHPSEVGGWGFRGLPGMATIMLRGGECLVVGYRSGGRLAISIDDAERGASLINALVAERARS